MRPILLAADSADSDHRLTPSWRLGAGSRPQECRHTVPRSGVDPGRFGLCPSCSCQSVLRSRHRTSQSEPFSSWRRPSRCHFGGCGSLARPLPGSRPLATASRMLSPCVPKNRCLGLIQGGLSQRCRTSRPTGICPNSRIHATLWAPLTQRLPETRVSPMCPYPRAGQVDPVHGQHSSGSPQATLAQKRVSSSR